MQMMKLGKAAGPSEVSTEMVVASGEIGIQVMMELCQRVLDGKGIPTEWKTSILVPIFKGKGDVMNCSSYRGIKLLEHAMKIVERVLEKRIRRIIDLDEMQFGFMQGRGTADAIFILRRLQEAYREVDKKLYICFVDMEKAFDRVPRRVVEWSLRKKGLPERLVCAVMSLYDEAKTRIRVGSGLSDEFAVKVGVHQGSVLSPLLFAIAVDVIVEEAREGLMYEILYADDLVIVSETMEELREKFKKWKEALERKGMKINLGKTKVMVSGSEGKRSDSKIDPCSVCGKRVMANSMVCKKCEKWTHGRCARVKRVTTTIARDFICTRCKNNEKRKYEPLKELCDGVETINEFCYLGDRLDSQGGCEVAVTARMRLGWTKFRECGDLLRGRRYTLKFKGKIYCSCVRSAMLYGSESWCLREKELDIMKRTERAMIRAMCGVKLMDRRNTEQLMDMLGLDETLDGLAKANGMRWYGHILRREDDDVLRKALDFRVNGKKKRGRPKMTWLTKVKENIDKVGLKREDALDRAEWRKGIKKMAMRKIRPPPATGKTPNRKWTK